MKVRDVNGESIGSSARGESLILQPIGHVESAFVEGGTPGQDLPETSRIILDPAFSDGLDGLSPGEEILVIFWFHRSTGYQLRQHPKGDTTRAKRGVFSLRSPHRPTPIGITQVRITSLEGNIMNVTGLDAFSGTPVLDLKPVGRGR